MTAHICYTCHLLRHCKGCCHTCKDECNMWHYCELHHNGMTETEGWQWWYNVTSVIDAEKIISLYPEIIPKGIAKQMERMKGKTIQLKLFDL